MKTVNTRSNRSWPGFLSWRYAKAMGLALAISWMNMAQADAQVAESDSLALVAFYHSMSGEHWINNGGWLVDRVDTWFGVTTTNIGTAQNPNWRVTRIVLANNMTQPGSLPPEFGNLHHLTDLELRGDPALFGPWPPEIANFIRVNELRTQDTNMSGEIPWDALAQTDIRRIRFQASKHFGEIPDGIFNGMTRIDRIEIADQFISGTIPSSLTAPRTLR